MRGRVGGKIRLLKNIPGMWFVQDCRREWARQGNEMDYATLMGYGGEGGAAGGDFGSWTMGFLRTWRHAGEVVAYCQADGAAGAGTPGEIVRVILESLAATYREVLEMLSEITGEAV